MSHRGVESVLGRLATDPAARRRFREAPVATLRSLVNLGLELSAVEIDALRSVAPAALERFARALDPRLQKAVFTRVGETPEPGDDPAGEGQ